MTFKLTIEPLGQTIEVLERQTILDASLRAGIFLPHACCHGVCSTCKVDLLEGQVDHGDASSFALMDYERQEGKCLTCCATLQSDAAIEADIEVEPDARNIPVRDFTGIVSRLESLTPTIKGVWIKLGGQQRLHFQAGQYINLAAPRENIVRPFSIASPPQIDGEIELNVRLVSGGRVTSWIHERLHIGAEVRFSGPYGRFFVRKSTDIPIIFVAGGSGLSSPKSMILDLLDESFARPVTLCYGARSRDELYYHEMFTELAARRSNFTYEPSLSDEPVSSSWRGARGMIADAMKERFGGDFRGHKAYLCGPPAMIESCIMTLIQGRLFERDIYTEKFYSAADARQMRSPLFKTI